jgi:hypothetical protein
MSCGAETERSIKRAIPLASCRQTTDDFCDWLLPPGYQYADTVLKAAADDLGCLKRYSERISARDEVCNF